MLKGSPNPQLEPRAWLKAHILCNSASVVHTIYNLVMEHSLVTRNKIKARGVVRAKVQTKQAFTVYPHYLRLDLGQ